jgi:cytidyltransferase-like protein
MIIQVEDLSELRQKCGDKRIVLGCGVFDLLHRGQVKYLQALKEYGDIVVVGIRSDASVRQFKGDDRPIIPEDDRAALVDAIKGVDYTFILPHRPDKEHLRDTGYMIVFDTLEPDIFVTPNDNWKAEKDNIKAEMVVPPRFEGHFSSTSAIIEHVKHL